MRSKNNQTPANTKCPLSQEEVEHLLETLKTIKYGSLTLIIQDGKVVQIDINEKKRLI